MGLDDRHGPLVLGADDHAASLVDRPHDRSLELRRRLHDHLHDRFVDNRLGLGIALPKGAAGRCLEGHVRRVHGVGGPVIDDDLNPVTGNSILGPLARQARKPFSQAAMNCVGIEPPVTLLSNTKSSSATWFDLAGHTAVLAGAARLFPVDIIELGPLRDGLPVGHLRVPGDDLRVILALHALHVDFQVQLAHALDDGFVGLVIDVTPERGVFLREAVEGLGHVDLRLVVLRLDASEMTGSGTNMDVMVRLTPGATKVSPEAQSIPNRAPMKPAEMASMSSIWSACMRHSTTDLDFLPGPDIDDGVSPWKCFPGRPGYRSAARSAPSSNLKARATTGLSGSLGQDDRCFGVVRVEGGVFHVSGAGQHQVDCIQKWLNPFVLIGRSHKDRRKPARITPCRSADQKSGGDLPFLQGGFGKLIGENARLINKHFPPPGRRLLPKRFGNRLNPDDFTVIAVKIQRFHGNKIHNTLKIHLEPDGHLQRNGVMAEFRS